ncbi:malonyl-CoA decarboxylase domain-containing protein [Streptomyces sp. AA1529]|uniref:malonyl-CoA decarboxylase domain-containing protein n=1 Tax=Streptomyces sp. AA1529 TaxID=1203257 RepID=UPI0003FAAFDB
MEPQDGRLLTGQFRNSGSRPDSTPAAGPGGGGGDLRHRPLDRLSAACEVLMGHAGEASMRTVAAAALAAYGELDDHGKRAFFTRVTSAYDASPDRIRTAFRRWEEARSRGSRGAEELVQLFDEVEPPRQLLLRRMNHAPGATLALVGMRADLRRLMRSDPRLRPLDHDFHHLLTSWFNRGFLRMSEVGWEAPEELHQYLLRGEKVHPMASRAELRRRLQPEDRRVYAFFHPATGDVPLIFVEVALVRGMPDSIAPLLEPGPVLDPAQADTAALYSINNALDGLAGVSFGSFLIKQVIEDVGEQLPQLRQFATLSPVPGFRRWLTERARREDGLRTLLEELEAAERQRDPAAAGSARTRSRLLPVLARYIAVERHEDGRPLDPVARFHLGNGAAAWQANWPANDAPEAWRQSFGAMVNYRYEPEHVERRHEEFVRHRTVALGGPLRAALPHHGRPPAAGTGTADDRTARGGSAHPRG